MKAIVGTNKDNLTVQDVPQPQKPAPGHMIIQMQAMGINEGDKLFIAATMPAGFFPESQYNIKGVSGVGRVLAIGDGVPARYKDKVVTVYRSLKFSDHLVGTWSEFTQLHYQQCVILPDNVDPITYAGSLVNVITSYAFLQQAIAEGHKSMLVTAGNSATGLAMLGICLAKNFPLISVVRSESAKKELEDLGAKQVILQSELPGKLPATVVFDGVGGAVVNDLIDKLPVGASIYNYGQLGANVPYAVNTGLLRTGLSVRGFSNFRTATVQDPVKLDAALQDLETMIGQPYFQTKVGQTFSLDNFQDALAYKGGKAILMPIR
jgi:NADPH:quinone reductase